MAQASSPGVSRTRPPINTVQGQPAGDFPGGHPTHPIGDGHPVPGLLVLGHQLAFGEAGDHRLEEPPETDDEEVVLVVAPDLAGVGQPGDIRFDHNRR